MFKHLKLKQKEEKMTKISKLFLGMLFSALLISPSFAGEMTVTGGAKASYVTNGDDDSLGKNLGVSNELDFSASGELDNGMTWSYQVQLDNATANNDDSKLVLGTDYGTIGIFSTEGGLSQELAHGVGALGVGYDHLSPTSFEVGYDVSDYSNIQYHLPADLLPFGATVKVGYVPNMSATAQLSKGDSAASTSQATGRTLEMITVGLAPIDGLTINADAAQTGNATGSTGTNGREDGVSANVGAKFTYGQVSIGYGEGASQPAVASGELAYYEQLQQYLSLSDMKLTGHPQIRYLRRDNKLFIDGDLKPDNSPLKVGEFLMIEFYVHQRTDGNADKFFNNMFLKEFGTALLKKQWGENISKFD